jgi:hypothetical protein
MCNLTAVKAAADVRRIAFAGIELTTKEEAHMLCYFIDLESALRFRGRFADIYRIFQ